LIIADDAELVSPSDSLVGITFRCSGEVLRKKKHTKRKRMLFRIARYVVGALRSGRDGEPPSVLSLRGATGMMVRHFPFKRLAIYFAVFYLKRRMVHIGRFTFWLLGLF
jgi:hypothetical protein